MPDTRDPRGTWLGRTAARIDAATPPHRDRAVDALRALAIVGVVLGHWLVTALVADGHTLRASSPLASMPWLAPVSWTFQTLAVFFMVGGHVATRSYASARERARDAGGEGRTAGAGHTHGGGAGPRGGAYGYRRGVYVPWLRARLARLFLPVAALVGVWAVLAVCLLLGGASLVTVHTVVKLALSPLWFLLVFAVLTAATPLLARLNPLWPLVVVLHVDLVRFGLGGPAWLGWVNLAAGWAVPYTLGAAWTRGELERPRAGWVLLAGGAVVTAVLVRWGGYPASMVGVPGQDVSNLNPPTLAAVAFGLAQCGLALLLRGRLRRAMRRPRTWAAVALLNLSAMTVFLWHQTALMATTALALPAGHLPGLHTRPDTLAWVPHRLLWLPAFALALAVCWAAFHGWENRPGRRGDGSRVVRTKGAPRAGRAVNRPPRPDREPPAVTRTSVYLRTGRKQGLPCPETSARKGIGGA
ncbi:acyltransferase [Streptomyces roseirectus]|uniref:Acyltransferase n=1 Tax=Streptomyces roseirectus TaxID=2768066 RepID=A0A7H0IEL6_9ACTN|nr:acyltransferase [Streptomyces roseirectus]QNP71232.1 acyltransferase [Streptomyces roseirectus]